MVEGRDEARAHPLCGRGPAVRDSLLERLTPEGLIITKRGKPVARLIPYPQKPATLIGSLRERIRIHGDILSTRIPWNAHDQP